MIPRWTLFAFLSLVPSIAAQSQRAQGYRLPPADVVDVVDAAPTPSVSISPDGAWMLLSERSALPSIADVSRRMLRLAGTRIDPAANAPFRTSFDVGLLVRRLEGGEPVRVPLPEGAKLAGTSWSHDSQTFAIVVVTDAGSELWTADVDEPAKPRRLAAGLHTLTGGPRWMPDGKTILCRLVPANRGEEPVPPLAPAGPSIQETGGEKSPLRTYQDLLQNEYDERLFDYYAISQLALIPSSGGEGRMLGKPALYRGASPSPDGRFLLMTRVERPYSYLMPWRSFPHEVEVWKANGDLVKTIASLPLEENVPIGGVRVGPRSFQWQASAPSTLVWTEALDGGDPKVEAEHRDRFLASSAPFEGEATELLRVQHRARGLAWFQDPLLVAASDYDRDRRWQRTLLFHLGDKDREPKVLEDRSIRDRYGDPGRLVTEIQPNGVRLLRQDGSWVYRAGAGASPEGLLPFFDRQSLVTLATDRLWRCERGSYESVSEVLATSAEDRPRFVTSHQSPESPPNYRLHGDGDPRALTSFPDPTPEIRGVTKRLVKYERSDGVPLSATLYLPAGYEEGTRLPLLVWAYPIEYNDSKTAGQVGTSPWRFTRIAGSSHLHLLSQGYAIMDGATMPVIGDPETMNDTLIEQIVDAAQAAIGKAAELGVADPERVGVGGHSYGAFMTGNLLAHTDLFKAGVARSGAYNRTLTPFGFQSERRTLWEAPDAYFAVSPFMHAEKINEPMLMIHGEADNNSGTFPMQSRRLFQAIKGNGGKARLVMLPNESHGYRARESVLHVLAETIEWFDKYVKGAAVVDAGYSEDR